jgi:uncharacterized protein (TIGR02687 family)
MTNSAGNNRVLNALFSLFQANKIVFWYDPDAAFLSVVEGWDHPDITLIRLDQVPAFKVKVLLERAPQSRWLLYSPAAEPAQQDDWLLDLRLRGKSFYADSISILMEDLGITTQSLREHLKTRAKFLRAKERLDRLKRLVTPSDTAPDIDRKMMAVLCRAEQADLFSILLKLFSALVVEREADLNASPKAWVEIQANELEPAFWQLVRDELGYAEPEPSLRDLLCQILVTDFARSQTGALPQQLKHFVLPDPALAVNAVVFAGRWRSDLNHYTSYDLISADVTEDLQLKALLDPMPVADLLDSMTFEAVELRIIKEIKDRILSGAGAVQETLASWITRRRDGHWANRLLAESNDRSRALVACYDALEVAASYFQLKAVYADGFSFGNATAAFEQYCQTYYKFDQLYRQFNYAADQVEPMGWAVLHELRRQIEDHYAGWYLPQMGSAWAKILEGDEGLLKNWHISEVPNQQNFYDEYVAPHLNAGKKRVFVIISDAMRYEVAQELVQTINSKNRLKAELGAQLGVLPSYTTLGMAALLPHETLAYRLNSNLEVLADGASVATTDQRNSYLERFEGAAIKSEDLMSLGKERGREFVRDKKVIYVYHDRIDLIGDKQASESKTFEAVADTVTELTQLVSFIVNGLNGAHLLLTADHGFLYQESALETADKAVLIEKPEAALRSKKRYVLGQDLGDSPKVWRGSTDVTAGTSPEGSLEFWVPKGASRFHLAGGARFVHGGAMPQEVVVPVISIREDESGKAKTKPVCFSLLGASNRIVTNTQRFEFIQTEPVTERALARTVLISIRDGEDLVSNEQSLTLDSTAQLLDERKRSLFVTVKAGNYDRNKDYYLVARDAITKIEALRQPVRIDLAFSNDF